VAATLLEPESRLCYKESVPPARIGTEFAGYRLEALVGRGGTSTVYRAENPRLGIPVALKVLNPEVAEDESFRERFVRESRLAAGINHPNIIPIYDAGVWEDSLYIAMRYVVGGDLKARVREGPMPPDRALSILAQAGSGLDAAHARGLVHRDIKPANIMVDSGPGPDAPEIAYVTDFGLIKNVQSGGRATPTGEFLGTIDYVAPEQIEGRAVDGRTDVYSLGCLAFECLTGRVPFERENDAAILWAHMQESPPSAASLNPDLPGGVDKALARAMAKRPDDRFRTCGELVGALRDELESDTGRRASLTLPVKRRPPARSWAGVGRVAALAAGLALGGAAATALLLLVDGDGRETRTVTRGETVTRTITAPPESRLTAAIPEGYRERCNRAAVPTPDFEESFLCRPGRGIDIVRFSRALSGPLMTDYLIRRLSRVGIPPPTQPGTRIQQVGSCVERRLPAVAEWRRVGRAGHEIVGRALFGNLDGRVLCYIAGENARIEWTTAVIGVYGFAQAGSYSRLLAWWQDEAGPIG
jgi:serine/threonine-protein kinase